MMKNAKISSFTILLALLGGFSSCTKEQVNGGVGRPSSPMALITCQVDVDLVCDNTIPHYASVQDFEDAYTCLETDYEAHNNAYEALYSTLSDDDYDDQVEADNFNEEQPLDDWESNYGYSSLRSELTNLEDVWLANDMVGADPFDHAIADIIFMTLINADGDVKIGSVLYHFFPDGSVVSVSDGDCELFATAKSNPQYSNERINFIPVAQETCQHIEHEDGVQEFRSNANRRFKWRVDFDSYIASSRAKTTVRNFKKKNGNWKRASATSYVYIGGINWNNECLESAPFSFNEKEKKRKRLGTRRFIPSFSKIKSGEVQGLIVQVEDGAYIDTVINW